MVMASGIKERESVEDRGEAGEGGQGKGEGDNGRIEGRSLWPEQGFSLDRMQAAAPPSLL